MRTCSILLIVLGVLLIALSPLWRRVASSNVFFDKAQSQEYAASVAEMHHANSEAATGEQNVNVSQSQERFKRSQAKLSRAREFRDRGGAIMRWIGGIAAIVGIGLYQIARTSDS